MLKQLVLKFCNSGVDCFDNGGAVTLKVRMLQYCNIRSLRDREKVKLHRKPR